MPSIMDNFLPPVQEKRKRRKPNMVEKYFMPEGEKGNDLFTALKASGNPKVDDLTQTALDLTYADLNQQELRLRLNALIRDLFTGQKQLVHGPNATPLSRSQREFLKDIIRDFGDKSKEELSKLFDPPMIEWLSSIRDDTKAKTRLQLDFVSENRKSRTLSKEQVDSCKVIFGEDAPFCDPQNVFGKMFPAKKSTWLKSYKRWSGQK